MVEDIANFFEISSTIFCKIQEKNLTFFFVKDAQ